MAKPEWGVKRICPNCGTRYYDMQKDPAVCPKCGTEYDPEALLRSRRARPIPAEEPVKAVVDDEEVETAEETEDETVDEDADIEAGDEDDEDVVLEDADDLVDDDVDEVVDVENGDEEEH